VTLDEGLIPQDERDAKKEQQSVVDQARAFASQMRSSVMPQEAPRPERSDVDVLTRWVKLNDPASTTKSFQDVWDNGHNYVKDYVRTYRGAPKDVQLKDQQVFNDTLAAYNEVLKTKQLANGVTSSGAGLSGYMLGLGNVFNSTPEFAKFLDQKFGGAFDVPITQIDQEGNEIHGQLGLSRGEAILTAEQELRAMEKLGIKNAMDPTTMAVVRELNFGLQLSGLARTVGEFALVKKAAGAAGSGLRGGASALQAGGKPGMAGLARGAAGVAEFAAGKRFDKATGAVVPGGAFRSHLGPFPAHGATAGYIEGLSTYDNYIAGKIAEGLELQVDEDGNVRDPEEVKKELSGFWNRQGYALGKAGEGAKHGALAGFSFMLAGRAASLAGRAIVPGPVKSLESAFNKVFARDPSGFRPAMRKFVTENGLGKFARGVVHGTTEFTGGSLVLDHASNLIFGTPAPKWSSDDLATSLIVGAIFSGAMGAWGGLKGAKKGIVGEKAGMDPLKRIEAAKRGMGPSSKQAVDELVNRFRVDPKVVAEMVERSKQFGHDHGEATAALVQRYGFEVAKKRGQVFTGKEAVAAGYQPVLELPATTEPSKGYKPGGIEPEPPEVRPVEPKTPPPDVEGGLRSVQSALDWSRTVGDDVLGDASRQVRDLLRRPGISDAEVSALKRAEEVIQRRMEPEARGAQLEARRAREAVQDLTEDLDRLDRKIQDYVDTYGVTPNKMRRQRQELQAKLDAAKQGEVPEDFQPRKRATPLTERPRAPQPPGERLSPEEETVVRRLIESGRGQPSAPAQAPAAAAPKADRSIAVKAPKGPTRRDVVEEATRAPKRKASRTVSGPGVKAAPAVPAPQPAEAARGVPPSKPKAEPPASGRGEAAEAAAVEELLEKAALAAPSGKPTKSVEDALTQEADAELGKFARQLAKEGKFNEAYATIEEMEPGPERVLAQKYVDTRVEVSVKKKSRARPNRPPSTSKPSGKS
jgi:hypothetical protein